MMNKNRLGQAGWVEKDWATGVTTDMCQMPDTRDDPRCKAPAAASADSSSSWTSVFTGAKSTAPKSGGGFTQPAYKPPAFDLVSGIAKFNYNIGPAVESSTPGIAAQAAADSSSGMVLIIVFGGMALLGALGLLVWATKAPVSKKRKLRHKHN